MDAIIAAKKAEIQARFKKFLPNASATPAPGASTAGEGSSSAAAGAPRPSDIQQKLEQSKAKIQAQLSQSSSNKGLRPGLGVQQHPVIAAIYGTKDTQADPTNVNGSAGPASPASIAAVRKAMMLPKANIASTRANQRMAATLQSQQPGIDLRTSAIERAQHPHQDLKIEAPPPMSRNPFFDPRAHKSSRGRGRGLRFNRPGKVIEKIERVRAELKIEKLKKEIQDKVKATGMEMKVELVSDHTLALADDDVPEVEWWDIPLLYHSRSYDEVQERDLVFNELIPVDAQSAEKVPAITHYIYHPIPIPPPFEAKEKASARPLMLTPTERKKLRRQRRAEIQKEKQDKIRLGLLPPEQPKVRIANLMRVLGTEAVAEPTKVEAEVRRQMRVRVKEHEMRNKANKLTKAQKREKRDAQQQKDEEKGIFSAVYKIKDLSDGRNRYKVEINAQQHNLTGIGLLYEGCNLVIVEGNQKAVRKYKKLMLRRIRWDTSAKPEGRGRDSDDDSDDEHDDASDAEDQAGPGVGPKPLNIGELKSTDKCALVWEGEVPSRRFPVGIWRFRECEGERQVLETLGRYDAQEYWHLAKTYMQ